MIRSLRWRLQAWYALTLLAAIAIFAGVLYEQARTERMGRIDARLAGAAAYLDAALRAFPRHELETNSPSSRRRPNPPDDPLGLGPPDGPPDRRPPDRGPPDIDGPPDFDGPPDRGPPPRREGNREQAYAGLDLLPKEPGDADLPSSYYAIWRANGAVVKSTASQSLKTPVDAVSKLHFRSYGADRQAYQLGPNRTVVLVGVPMEHELANWRSLAWRLAGAGAAALAVGLLGGWLVSARILRPINRIADTAASISATNLAGRIDDQKLDTELVGLAQVLNDTFARLEDAFERQSRFVADASHELRTPVAVLHANLELALSRPRTPEEYRATLSSCLAASGRMRALADGLLTLARADAGRLDPDFQPLDLRTIARDAAARHAEPASQAGVSLSTALADSPVPVRGDAVYLGRVLDNLISNALRHTPSGGAVRIGVATDEGDALLTVADTGPGVADADKPRIFERFYRADAARSRSSGGYGLGLAICDGLVKAHGGTITVSNSPSGGALFTLRFPSPAAGEGLGVRVV